MARGSKRTDDGVRVFRYPLGYRIAFSIGAFLLGAYALVAATSLFRGRYVLAGPVAVIGLFAIVNAWLVWTLLVKVRTDAEGMTLSRLGRKRRILWRDVKAVEHRRRSASLLIRAQPECLRVHRQLQKYLEFYSVLKAAVPAEAIEPPMPIPFTIAASRTPHILSGGGFALFGFLGGYGMLRGGGGFAALLLLFAALSLYLWLWHAPLRFEFDRDGLRAVYLVRSVQYRAAEFESAELVQRRTEAVLRMHFGRKRVDLSDSQVRIAPERIHESVLAAYALQKR